MRTKEKSNGEQIVTIKPKNVILFTRTTCKTWCTYKTHCHVMSWKIIE